MKTLGLVGGTSWASTIDYYRYLNQMTGARLGSQHGARLVLYSFDYAEIVELTKAGNWGEVLERVTEACHHLTNAGAEGIMLCANTMHLIADKLQPRISVPIIHIVDATAAAIRRVGLTRVALLGTRYTMEMDFFKDRLAQHGIAVTIPARADRDFIHETIFGELGEGVIIPATKLRYCSIISELADQGAEGAILGCTEIPLLVTQADCKVPVFDTTAIHAAAGIDFSLGASRALTPAWAGALPD